MNDQTKKILIDLLQKASDGINSAVSFSKAQIPDVVHQLLVWNFVQSMVATVICLITIPIVVWFCIWQSRRVQCGVIGEDGYSWEKGKPKYKVTLAWCADGDLNPAVMFLAAIVVVWFGWVVTVLSNPVWLQIWLSPKLYIIQYAAQLIK